MPAFHTFVSLSALALAGRAAAKSVWATPHDSYSSSIGVLGCKINTDRVAYWPGSVDCNNICVKLSYGGRSVHLLRIDQSGGAYDISYDAWNYLQTGKSATTNPIAGGTVEMEAEEVDASECASLIKTPGNKLPLSAANSINFLSSCLAQPNSWIAKNHVLYNICDSICSLGHDEECKLDLSVSNQPSCPHTLGLTSKLTTAPVFNIQYQSGKTVVAGTGEAAAPQVKEPVEPAPAEETPKAPAPAPAPPKPQFSPAIFKEQTEKPSSVPAPAPPAAVATPSTTSTPPAVTVTPTSSWTTLVQAASSSVAIPTLSVSQPGPGYNATSPSAGKPSGGQPTSLNGPTASRVFAPTGSSTNTVVSGGQKATASLMALIAGGLASAAFLAI